MSVIGKRMFGLLAGWAALVSAGVPHAGAQLDVSVRLPDKSGRRIDRPDTGHMSPETKTYYPGKNDRTFTDMLERHFPGVKYVRGKVFIRNLPCLYYLVDGAAVPSLDMADPLSVKSISVLTDGAGTSIYGPRGRNGVVIVETFARTR